MGIFEDYAPKYFEAGLNVMPVDGKKPVVKEWQKWCTQQMTKDEFWSLVEKFPDHNIGLPLGPANNLMLFDYDYVGKDASYYEDLLRKTLPITSIERFGSKGFGMFFEYSNITFSKKVSREKELFYEILGEGRHTVVPPSIHPDSGLPYEWKGRHDIVDFANDDIDLPQLSGEILKTCEILKYSKMKTQELNKKSLNRNNNLFIYTLKASDYIDNIDDLAEDVYNEDIRMFGDDAYFQDKKEGHRHPPRVECRKRVESWITWKKKSSKKEGINWTLGGNHNQKTKKGSGYTNFEMFFNSYFEDIRYCPINEEAMIRNKADTWDNVQNHVKAIRSFATDHNLSPSRFEDSLSRFSDSLEPRLLIDIPEWDGKDHIGSFNKYIKISNVSEDCLTELFKEWFAGIFKRIDGLEHNKFIIFKGTQGIGKDSFIHHICKGFDYYYDEMNIVEKEKENYDVMKSLLIANIAEFDRTSRVSVQTLKNLVSAKSTRYRKSYGRAASKTFLRTSFISSCNIDDILRDHTGNRRYVIFDCSYIDWRYTKELDGLQVLAQAKALYDEGFKAKDTALLEMDDYIKKITPDDPMEVITDIYDERMTALYAMSVKYKKPKTEYDYHEVSSILQDISKMTGFKLQTVQRYLGSKERKMKPGGKVKYVVKLADNLSKVMDGLDNVTQFPKKD